MAVIALRYATGQHERSHAMAAVPAHPPVSAVVTR
jgi:hypothetical protein